MAREVTRQRREGTSGDGEGTRSGNLYRPNTDILETETHVVVVAEMPGVARDDIEVTLERGVLSMRGRGRTERPEGYQIAYAEYGEGDFERVFTLSEQIDSDRIDASYENGLLTLKLPKVDKARTKRIEVKSA